MSDFPRCPHARFHCERPPPSRYIFQQLYGVFFKKGTGCVFVKTPLFSSPLTPKSKKIALCPFSREIFAEDPHTRHGPPQTLSVLPPLSCFSPQKMRTPSNFPSPDMTSFITLSFVKKTSSFLARLSSAFLQRCSHSAPPDTLSPLITAFSFYRTFSNGTLVLSSPAFDTFAAILSPSPPSPTDWDGDPGLSRGRPLPPPYPPLEKKLSPYVSLVPIRIGVPLQPICCHPPFRIPPPTVSRLRLPQKHPPTPPPLHRRRPLHVRFQPSFVFWA